MAHCLPRTDIRRRLTRHFAAGALAAAGLPLVAAQVAEAGVVHAVVDWAVPVTVSGLYIDVQTKQIGELDIDVPDWDLNPYGTSNLMWFNAVGTGMMRFPGVVTGGPGSLAIGTTVGPSGSYGSGNVVIGTTPGNWHLNQSNYFGFKFIASDGLTHYGWGKFALGTSVAGADRRISEIAWDSVANHPIIVGDTGAPPPGYEPCAPSNPIAVVGANTLAMNQTAAVDLTVDSCAFTIRKANYFKFTAPEPGLYTVGTCGMTDDTRIAILNGCAAGSTVLACDDNSCGTAARTAFTAVAGGQYYIVVGGASVDLPSSISLTIDPPWSTCSAPRVATPGLNPFACDSHAASQLVSSGVEPGITRTIYNSTWFTFVPPSTSMYRFSLCGAAGNTQLAIAQHCAASPADVMDTLGYDDNGCPCADGSCDGLPWASLVDSSPFVDKRLANPLVAGTPYLVLIGGFSASDVPTGDLFIEDEAAGYNPCSPFNPTVSEGANLVQMMQGLAADIDLGVDGVAFRANLFKFTATFTGQYTVSTCGGGSDTALAVLADCAPGAAVLACARDNCGLQESVAFNAVSGTTYYVAVGSGTVLTVLPDLTPVMIEPPIDPACSGGAVLAFGAQAFDNASSALSRSVKSSVAGDTALIVKAKFYSFTPAVTGAYRFSLCGGTGDSQMAIGTACASLGARFESMAFNDESCGSLSVLDSTNGGAAGTPFGGFPLTEPLVAGQTYHLIVGSFSEDAAVSGTLVVSGPPQGGPADLNHDGVVDGSDLAILLGNWGGTGVGDIDQDGAVGGSDLAMLLGSWG